MSTDDPYTKVYANILVINSDGSFSPSGRIDFVPRISKIVVGKYLQVVEQQTCLLVDGEISGPSGNYITLPAPKEGLEWDATVRFDDYNAKGEFVVKSYPGAEITIGD